MGRASLHGDVRALLSPYPLVPQLRSGQHPTGRSPPLAGLG